MRDFFVARALAGGRDAADPRFAPAARPAGPRPPRPTATALFDLYAVFVAELRRFAAAGPRPEAEIAAHFGIEIEQTRRWIARAVAEGAVRATAGGIRAG
jgi:hypothetical protein